MTLGRRYNMSWSGKGLEGDVSAWPLPCPVLPQEAKQNPDLPWTVITLLGLGAVMETWKHSHNCCYLAPLYRVFFHRPATEKHLSP